MGAPAKLVTIIGGSGFVGTQLVQKMARAGFRIRVGVRRPDLAGHLLPLGAVGQVLPMQVNVRNMASIERAVAGADIVINLAGIWYETGKQRFAAVHSMGAANVAKAAAESGASTLVHMSELGADANADSADLISRVMGEKDVLAAFPKAIILRPATIFGADDHFFNLFGSFARIFPAMFVIGANHTKQPVFVGDVAEATILAATGKVKTGKIYELGGADVETMSELMTRVLRHSQRTNPLVKVPNWLVKLKATFMQILPNPWMTIDLVSKWNTDIVVSDLAVKEKRDFSAFGIDPKTMDAILPTYMWRFCKRGQFERAQA